MPLLFSWIRPNVSIIQEKGGYLLATLPPAEFTPTATYLLPLTTPVETEIVTLPLVGQNSGYPLLTPVVDSLRLQETPVPGSPELTATPTSTPLPPQTGTTNLPIVVGASAIYAIIILAWLMIGLRPRRSSDF
jgi:hypothetical protein